MLQGEHGRVSNKWRRAENSGQILRCGQAVADFYKITNKINEIYLIEIIGYFVSI